MRRLSTSILVFALATVAAASGCGGDGDGGGTGTLAVRVTDAPFPANCFLEASVTVDTIEIQPAGAQGNGGWIVVTSTAQTWNLLDLAGGISQTAAFVDLPTGRYHKIRLHVSNAVLTWNDGSGFQKSFTVPSGRVDITPQPVMILIAQGQTTNLTLDFDLARSFVQTGPPAATCSELKQAGKIIFSPVVRAVVTADSGLVQGIVTDSSGSGVAGATITATDQADPQDSTSTLSGDGSNGERIGSYALLLDAGSYDVTFEASGQTTVTETATVETGKTTTLDAQLP